MPRKQKPARRTPGLSHPEQIEIIAARWELINRRCRRTRCCRHRCSPGFADV